MSSKDEIRELAVKYGLGAYGCTNIHEAQRLESEIRALVERERDKAIIYLAWMDMRHEERVRALEIDRSRLRQVSLIYREYEPLINAKMRELIHREQGQ
jgi:hypothetical protein